MIADAFGKLYVISANHAVYVIDPLTRIATYMGHIQGLPGGYTTNAAAVNDEGNIVLASANMFDGYYTMKINDLKAVKMEGSDVKYNASDFANANLLLQKEANNLLNSKVVPTASVPVDAKVSSCEVFGPVIVLTKVGSTAEAFAAVNNSDYGLQAGVFTHDIQTAFLAQSTLEVGGVIIGDVPAFRADHMPYGGLKNSGVGKEGVRWAMEDLTHERIMVLTGLEL
jgi:hypothetical protein